MRAQAFLFDKDGTLLTYDHWQRVMVERARRLALRLGLPTRQAEELATFLHGNGQGWGLIHLPRPDAEKATVDYLAKLVQAPAHTLEDLVQSVFKEVDQDFPFEQHLQPTPGAAELLRRIRQVGGRVGIVTHDTAEAAWRHVRALGWRELVDVVVGLDVCAMRKPAAEPVLQACASLGVPPARAAMVGDLPIDLQAGRAAGCGWTVGVLTGLGTESDLAPFADAIVEDLQGVDPLPAQ